MIFDKTHKNVQDVYSLLRDSKRSNGGSNDIGSVKTPNISNSIFITDFPSPINDVFHIGKNGYKFSDIVLPKEIEEEIQNIVFEHKDEDFFVSMGLMPTNKVLFYGSPWCGKTMLTYTLAQMLRRELKIVNLSKLVSSHLWETSNNLASIFSKYGNRDTVLFIDEFDVIWRLRGDTGNDHNEMKRIVNTLLQLIDFFPSEGFLVFATNSIKIIDEALLRRLDRVIEIPLPNPSWIQKYLKLKMARYNDLIGKIDYKELSKSYSGSSFSEIQRLLQKKIKNKVIQQRKSGVIVKIRTEDLEKNQE